MGKTTILIVEDEAIVAADLSSTLEIRVESTPGKGATFTVLLPVKGE